MNAKQSSYSTLIDQDPPGRPSLWHRLLRPLADSIGDATIRREESRIRTEGIRAYQRELAERSRAALTRRVRRGWWLGPPPYGYRLAAHDFDDGTGRQLPRRRLVADTDCAPVVPVIFTLLVRDGRGCTAITARLAANLGYATCGRTQAVRGWTWSDEPSHTTLLDPTLWWAARDKLHPPQRPPGAGSSHDTIGADAARWEA